MSNRCPKNWRLDNTPSREKQDAFCYHRYMPQFFRIPKVQLVLALVLIAFTAILHRPTISTIFVFLLAVGFSILFDLLFLTLRRIKLFIPYAAIVSGLIIGLLTSPDTPRYQIVIISALAMAGKNFFRISDRHIFNPAGFGLLLAGVLFRHPISWWGVSFQTVARPLYFFILCLPLLVSGLRMKRYAGTFSFLITYTLVSSVFFLRAFSLQKFLVTLFDPTVIFFSVVMVPEPMTSPVQPKRQMLYGMMIAVTVAALSITRVSPDPLIAALLAGNLIFFRFRSLSS